MTSPALSVSRIEALLEPYLGGMGTEDIYLQLSTYLDLLLKWNGRTNLTAIRDPEEIVRRHFGESLFAARHLAPTSSLLDFGSGAGFPGLPIQLMRPELAVTLGESQNKKASFLREAVRTLGVRTEVWVDRIESMPATRRFSTVTLRAVDNMESALDAAIVRIAPGGQLAVLTTTDNAPPGSESLCLPHSSTGVLCLRTFHVEQSQVASLSA